MPGKFCKTCHSWEGKVFERSGDSFGQCNNVMVHAKVTPETKTVLEEDGTIFTEEYFGCVYWRENSGTLFSIDDQIKEDE